MPATRHRLVIDTNLWVNFLLTTDVTKSDRLFADDNIAILFGQELLDEFIEVAERPKFRKYFSPENVQNLLLELSTRTEFITVTSSVALCRDPKDDFLLALARDGQATHLLTGDKDLLVLESFGETKILTMTDYLSADNP